MAIESGNRILLRFFGGFDLGDIDLNSSNLISELYERSVPMGGNIINSNNALEKIAFKKYPKLIGLKLFLLKLSNIIFARMSGSGSSILAYFYSKKAAEIARKEFKKKFNDYWCITAKTI